MSRLTPEEIRLLDDKEKIRDPQEILWSTWLWAVRTYAGKSQLDLIADISFRHKDSRLVSGSFSDYERGFNYPKGNALVDQVVEVLGLSEDHRELGHLLLALDKGSKTFDEIPRRRVLHNLPERHKLLLSQSIKQANERVIALYSTDPTRRRSLRW